MRASLITALALGCCLHVDRARADDFDDDFGALPPPPPRAAHAPPVTAQPAAPAPAPPSPGPAMAPPATTTPEAVSAPPANDGIADPWYGDYPPLDDEDAPLPVLASRLRFLHPTIDGLLGGVHVVDAGSGAKRTFRVGVVGGFFRKDGFISRGDRHRQGLGTLVLDVTPIEHLEVAANVQVVSTQNRGNDPQLIQAVGDTHLFAKGYTSVQPWLQVGGDLELGLLNGVGSFGVGAVNVGLRANASADLRELPRHALPLIVRGNLRYLFDSSGKLVRGVERDRAASLSNAASSESEYRSLTTPAERSALGVNRVDQLGFALGVELPLLPHEKVPLAPLLEWSVGVPINRQGFDCLRTSVAGQRDRCLDSTGFATRPSNLTMGVRVQPYVSGLGVLLAVDVATSGARDFVRELAPLPRYMLRFALSYAYDPYAQRAVRPRVQRIAIPASDTRGRIVGQVVDARNGAPLPNAIVHFENTSLSDVVSDEAGAFRSAELGPGAQGMRVRAEGYRDALCVAVVDSRGSEVSARCELTPSAYYGELVGHVTDNVGQPLAHARVTLRGASEALLGSDDVGNFRVTKLVEGEYELRASVDGYFPRTVALTIARDVSTTPTLALVPRPDQPVVRVTAKRIVLLKPVAFAPDTAIILPESEPMLSEVAEQLQRHSELSQLEVQGHGEDGPVAPGEPPLTEQRAAAVRAWLVNAGVAPERLTARGLGPTRPLVPNITPANRARNRRIEIVVP